MTLPIWTFPPDWNKEVRVTYSYLTEVIVSREGREQRIAQRNTPRLDYEFSTLLEGYDYRTLVARMADQQWTAMLMPDWSRPIFLQRDHTAGETVLHFYDRDGWFVDGIDALLVWMDGEETKTLLVNLTEVVQNHATIAAALPYTVPKDAALHAMRQGHLSPSIKGTMQSDRLIALTVTFSIDPGFEEHKSAGVAPLTYNGRELFLTEPNWARPPSIDMTALLETLDYGVGRMAFFSPVPFSSRITSAEYLGADRDEVNDIVSLFRRQRGRQGEFFMPTFTEDLRLRSNAANGATVLRVIGPEAALHFADSLVYRHIAIFYEDGTKQMFGISNIDSISDADGNDSRLHLTSPTTQIVRVNDVDMICWLPLCRFASDDLVVQWITDEIANIGVTISTLEYLSAEA